MARILIVRGKNGRGPQKEWEVQTVGDDPDTARINVDALKDWIERERITEIRFAMGTVGRKGKGQIFTRATPIKPVIDMDELTKTVQMLEGM